MALFKSIHGRQLGLGENNELQSNGIDISMPCVDATVTVGNEAANVRAITVQLKDSNGDDIAYVETVEVILFSAAAKTGLTASSPSTGLEIGTDGALLQVVQHVLYLATSEADGDIDLTWTDTGSEAAWIGVRLPSGRIVMGSQALTNAT